MFNKLFQSYRKPFDIMYPSLALYIKDKDEQESIRNNQDFQDKYNSNAFMINTFINDIANYYKLYEVHDMIFKYIINQDKDKMVNMLMNYLNSSVYEREARDFFIFYDKVYGLEDKSEEQIKDEEEIDFNYNALKTGTEMFDGQLLDKLYFDLDYPERSFVVSIVSHRNGWKVFKEFFEDRYGINFKALVKLLNGKLIDGTIINETVKSSLGYDSFEELIFTLMSNHNIEITKHIKTLIKKERLDLIEDMIYNELIYDHIFVNSLCNEVTNDNDLIEKLETIRVKKPLNN